MNPNSANSFNSGQNPAYPNAGPNPDPKVPVNPFANTGQSPNLGANLDTSMRHKAVPVVGVNVMQAPNMPVEKHSENGVGRTIALVIACLSAAAAIIAMVAFFVNWQNLERNHENDTLLAIEAGKLDQQQEDDLEFLERDKEPWLEFNGVPDTLGGLTFNYPKTWNAYVAKDGLDGGDFESYFRPSEVLPTGDDRSRYALRLSIVSKYYDNVVDEYNQKVAEYNEDEFPETKLESKGSLQSFDGTSMRFDGTIDENLNGSVVLVKINDRTAILQTDSEVYQTDYDKLIGTLKRNSLL